ncbi:MAG: GYF domain-containing protein, partial [Bradymonadaceae bacterium]
MKFYCDKCQTKYSIADEKVQGKVLKVRCKKCSHVITVREPTAPVKPSAPKPARGAPPPPPPPARVKWYYAINGETIGPFGLNKLQQMFASGELGDAVYVWNETFTQWKPVYEVPQFHGALDKALKIRPRAKTLGISQALEAIKIGEKKDDAKDTLIDAAAPASPAKPTKSSAPQPRKQLPGLFKKTPEADREDSDRDSAGLARSERLARLRQRLHGDEESVEEKTESPAPEADTDLDVAFGDTVDALETSDEDADGKPEIDVAPSTEVGQDLAPNLEVPLDHGPSIHDGLFSGGEGGFASVQDDDSLESEAGADDEVPFFPSAPRLESTAPAARSRSEEITGSLLIQLNSIRKEGRGKAIGFAVAAVLVLAGVIGTSFYFISNQPVQEVEEEKPRMIAGVQGREPVFRTYSKAEQGRIKNLVELKDDVITREEAQAFVDEERAAGENTRSARPRAGAAQAAQPIDPFEAAMDGATAGTGGSAGLARGG